MYSRETELRHLLPNDVYNLGVILDDNNCWKKLMAVIPKELTAQSSNTLDWDRTVVASGLKYNSDHMRLIENAIRRSGESRLFSQILFDEWGTSGQKNERPTVGVLLQLLVQAELYRAAEFVATKFLNEPAPARPLNGPAARIDITLSDELYNDVADYANDSSYFPETNTLHDIGNGGMMHTVAADNNKDYYSKYHCVDKQDVIMNDVIMPRPPPRPLRSARLQMQQQQQKLEQQETTKESNTEATATVAANNGSSVASANDHNDAHDDADDIQQSVTNTTASMNIPIISALNVPDCSFVSNTIASSVIVYSQNTESTNLSDEDELMLPNISMFNQVTTERVPADQTNDIHVMTDNEILPLISKLNVTGERDGETASTSNNTTTTAIDVPAIDELLQQRDCTLDLTSDRNQQSSRSSSISNASIDDDDIADVDDDNDDIDGDDDDDDIDDDDNSLPNLTLLRQRNSNDNDSSLTNVTGTSGENSFDLSMNDCSSASNENIPCLSELKQ